MAAENKRFVYPFQTKLNNENTDIRTAYTKRESVFFHFNIQNETNIVQLISLTNHRISFRNSSNKFNFETASFHFQE